MKGTDEKKVQRLERIIYELMVLHKEDFNGFKNLAEQSNSIKIVDLAYRIQNLRGE